MDGAWLGSIDISIRKARTARYFDMPTGEIGKLSQPGGSLYNIEHSNGGLITFPGGVPIRNAAGAVIGAIGVSGDAVENDHAVAEAGAAAVKSRIRLRTITGKERIMPTDRSAESKSIGQYLIDRLIASGAARRVRHPGRLRAVVLRDARAEPDPGRRLHARGLRRLRGRRLRPRQRHGRGVRHLLRGRAEPVQLDRRGLRREVAGGGDQRLAGPARAGQQSAAAPQGAGLPHAVRGLPAAVRRRRPS